MKSKSWFQRLYIAQGLLAGAYLLSLFAFLYANSSQDAAARHSIALAAYAQRIHSAALSCRRLLKLSRGHATIAQAEAARREASGRLAQTRSAGRNEISPEESAQLDKLSRFVNASGALLAKVARLKSQGRTNEASSLYDTRLRPMVEQYVASAVEARLREEQANRLENTRQSQLWTWVSAGAIAVFASLTCLFFALYTRRLINYGTGNLARVQTALTAIRSGNFQISIEPDRADELGAICTNLKSLAARLEQAQGRMDDVTQLANEASQSLNEVVFAAGEYVSLARQKSTLDAQDECCLNLILERAKHCNLLLGRLCELAAGQKLLAEDSPELIEAIDGITESLRPTARKQAADTPKD
jgi:methyl-accepting chemotaxis protein